MEIALSELCGRKRWHGEAETFSNPIYVCNAIRTACQRIRATINDVVTADDRLLLTANSQIDRIEHAANKLGKRQAAEVAVLRD
jgi:hypothetical protein